MRIAFMGTPALSADILEALAREHDLAAVFTRPDAIRGRGSRLEGSPVRIAAERFGIPVFTPSTLRDRAVQAQIAALAPDAICVAAYGAILPREVLAIPRFGCINVHTSLLPRWRGAAPIQRAILAQDEVTGVCIMRMEEGLDTGPVCRRAQVELDGLYLAEAEKILAEEGAKALLGALGDLQDGTAEWVLQNEDGAIYAGKIAKGELDPDPGDSAALSCAKVRAASDAHPARIEIAGRRATVQRAHPATDGLAKEATAQLAPGQAVFRAKRLLLRAADGAFEIEQLKPEGRKSMDARSFAAGIQNIKSMQITWGRV